MKFNKCFLSILALTLTASFAHATAELDSEINDLQVQIIRRQPAPPPKVAVKAKQKQVQVQTPAKRTYYAATPVVNQSPAIYQVPVANANTATPLYHRHATLIADNGSQTFVPTDSTDNNYQNPRPRVRQIRPVPQQQDDQASKIIRKIEFMPALSISSFDGSASSTVVPSGTSNPYSLSPSGLILADVDFGFHNVYVETGFMVSQLGSGTGYGFGGSTQFVTSEKVALTYLGIPVNLKWIFNGEGNNSFYIKGGAVPSFMMSHTYTSSGVDSEARFGGYNLFDLLADAGAGYDFKVWGNFHVDVNVSVYQGIFQVLTNYSVYNFAIMPGVGIGYMF